MITLKEYFNVGKYIIKSRSDIHNTHKNAFFNFDKTEDNF